MTAKQKVLQKYPDAKAKKYKIKVGEYHLYTWQIESRLSKNMDYYPLIGKGKTEFKAWVNAKKKIEATK
jgi:hypothetical protein